MPNAEKPAKKLMQVDAYELAMCIFCSLNKIQTPPNLTAQESLEQLSPEIQGDSLRAARAAFEHFVRCMRNGDIKVEEIANFQRGNA